MINEKHIVSTSFGPNQGFSDDYELPSFTQLLNLKLKRWTGFKKQLERKTIKLI